MRSQNGYLVLETNRTTGPLPRLRNWNIPTTNRHVLLRDGSAGFLLAHFALWWHETIEPLNVGVWDEWGWAVRPIRGQTTGYSNHASGTAVDLNATMHPRGVPTRKTLSAGEVDKIHARLRLYKGCLRWGGDYTGTPDAMHVEVNKPLGDAERVARELWDSKRGRRVLAANPGAAEVIWDGHVPQPAPAPVPKPVPVPTPTPAVDPPPVQVTRRAIDYSYARPDPAAIKEAGFRGVFRYLAGGTNPAKELTRAEATALRSQGLWVGLVWEWTPKRASAGRLAGVADAKAAEAQASNLGVPRDVAIFYAVDYDAQPSDVAAYFEGIRATATHPVGVYGSFRIVEAGLARWRWQTKAWSHGRVSTTAHIVQLTTHTRTITGALSSDWDEDELPRGVVPVWQPIQAPALPPVPAGAVRVRHGQVNVQQTDPAVTVIDHIHAQAPKFDVIVWNELGKLALQNAVRELAGFDSFLPGSTATKATAASAVGISWRSNLYRLVDSGSIRVHGGVLHVTPARFINWVLLEEMGTGVRFYAVGTQVVHHIEVGGRARIIGKLYGQNYRARIHFARLVAFMAVLRETGVPVVGSGDLNVDWFAEKALPPSRRTPWFPYTVLRAVANVVPPREGTHGARAIDWVWTVGPVHVVSDRVLPRGSSDHNPRRTTVDITKGNT